MAYSLHNLKKKQDQIFESLTAILTAMASPVRLKIIHLLIQAPQPVEALAIKLQQSVANTSMHLRKMYHEGLLQVSIQGRQRVYSLAYPALLHFWEHLQDFAQEKDASLRLDTEKIYGNKFDWSKDWPQTLPLLHQGKAVLLDVRPSDEIVPENVLPLKKVMHIPQDKLQDRFRELPRNKFLLVFCRGRFCVLAAESVNYLRQQGLKAYRLQLSWFQIFQSLNGLKKSNLKLNSERRKE